MSRIFISYRREDTSGYAGRLHERLGRHFGDHQVFMDIDAIEPGLDYQDLIESTLDTVDVMVVLIGRQWLNAHGPTGARRLDDPDDLVRLEVEGALLRSVRVIPVLVEATAMPTVHDLPPSLQKLARRNAIDLSDSRWDYDCERLVGVVGRAFGGAASPGPVPAPEPVPAPAVPHRQPVAQQAIVVAAALVVLVWGVVAPRTWHTEGAVYRIAVETALVGLVVAGVWSKQWRMVLAGGLVGVIGLLAWIQILVAGGHTSNDLFGSPDGPANALALLGSIAVLVVGAIGVRRERGAAARGPQPVSASISSAWRPLR